MSRQRIPTNMLADGAVTTIKHAANSIDSTKVIDGAIAQADLAKPSVGTGELFDANITNAKIGPREIIAGQKLYNADFRGLGAVFADMVYAQGAAPNANQGAIAFGNAGTQIYWNGAAWVITPPFPILAPLYDFVGTADYWTNTALGAGDNGFSGLPVNVTLPAGLSYVLMTVSVNMLLNGINANSTCGWNVTVQNARYRQISRVSYASNAINYNGITTMVLIPPSAWGTGSGTRQFGVTFYSAVALSGQTYLRCGSQPEVEYLRFSVYGVY
jgi:hypothetical protein